MSDGNVNESRDGIDHEERLRKEIDQLVAEIRELAAAPKSPERDRLVNEKSRQLQEKQAELERLRVRPNR